MEKIFIARHAEREDIVNPEWVKSATRPYDTPLSKNGLKQAREMGQHLKDKGITEIYASPFLRTVQTAHAAAEEMGGIPVKLEWGMAEWHNPDWQKSSPKTLSENELKARFPLVDLSHKSVKRPKYPEKASDIIERASATARELTARNKGKNVLLVGHGPTVISASRALAGDKLAVLPNLAGVVEMEKQPNGGFKIANGGKPWKPVKNPHKCE
jgi:broad specificity phosphatase PhoE